MKTSRRQFLTSSAAIAATSALPGYSLAQSQKKMLLHQVYFWLKNSGSQEDLDSLVKGIRTLEKIKSVKKLHVGIVAVTEKRPAVDSSWSVSLLVFCDDIAGEAAYQVDPIHKAFVSNYSSLWEKVVIYDSLEV